MKTISQYQAEVIANRNSPGKLAEIGVEIAADYAYTSEKYGIREIQRAAYFKENKEREGGKPMSDKMLEANWMTTEEGSRWRTCKSRLKGLERMQSSIKSLVYVSNQEVNNQL